jgi:hypothetical protein
LGKDYRALSYNSWTYFKLVYRLTSICASDHVHMSEKKTHQSTSSSSHYSSNSNSNSSPQNRSIDLGDCGGGGGGDGEGHIVIGCGKNDQISRREESIYSQKAYSELNAVLMIQSCMRRKLSKMMLNRLLNDHFLENNESAKLACFEESMKQQHDYAMLFKSKQEEKRRMKHLEDSANFTRSMWRKKKININNSNNNGGSAPVQSLKEKAQLNMIKSAQDVFANHAEVDLSTSSSSSSSSTLSSTCLLSSEVTVNNHDFVVTSLR